MTKSIIELSGVFICVLILRIGCDDNEQQLNNLGGRYVSVEKAVGVTSWPSSLLLDYLGQVSGVSFCPKGFLFVFQRAGRRFDDESFDSSNNFRDKEDGPINQSPILKINNELKDPNVVAEFGADIFYLPHGIFTDDKYMWTTDLALHQVLRIPHGKNKPDMTIGTKFEPGSDSSHLCKPTHVVTAHKDGSIFVADGYCNSRILKFDSSGKLLRQFANLGAQKTNIPHHLVLVESSNMICVADRENKRMQCFNAGLTNSAKTGQHIRTVSHTDFGPIYAVGHNNHTGLFYMVSGIDRQHRKSRVFIYNWEIDRVIGKIDYPGQYGFGMAHSITVSPHGNFIVIGGLTKECPADSLTCLVQDSPVYQMRNLWLYGLVNDRVAV